MTQLESTAWQYLCCPMAFFGTHGKDLSIYLFFNIQKEIMKSNA